MAKRLLTAYTRSFERSPYVTLLVTNGVLMGFGDFSAQTLGSLAGISSGALGYDAVRTLRFAVFGASMGPLAGAWNKFLEVNFPLRPNVEQGPINMTKVKVEQPLRSPTSSPIPGLRLPTGSKLERGTRSPSPIDLPPMPHATPNVSVLALAKRVAADQFGMAPVSLFIFLFSMSLLEGLDSEETYEKIRANYMPILFVNWQVWPILQLINFRYIPLKYRVPFGSICGIAWTCFLSFKTNAVPVEAA